MGAHRSSVEMRILANSLLTLCLLGICEAGQEVVQYAKTRNLSSLSGTVVDRTGAAIPDAQVCTMSAGWKTELQCTTTDSDGRWALSVRSKETLPALRESEFQPSVDQGASDHAGRCTTECRNARGHLT